MPKVIHVKSARRPLPHIGVAVGDSYYHWSIMVGGRGQKQYSKSKPRRSQLTRSEFKGALFDLEDDLLRICYIRDTDEAETLSAALDQAADTVDQLKDDCQDKLDNMPDSLQQGSTGELLQERIDFCESLASELRQCKDDLDDMMGDAPELVASENDDEPNQYDYFDGAGEALLANISWDAP